MKKRIANMEIKNTYLFGRTLNKEQWTPAELEEIGRKAQAARIAASKPEPTAPTKSTK